MSLKACVKCGYVTTPVTTCPQCGRKPRALGATVANVAIMALAVYAAFHLMSWGVG